MCDRCDTVVWLSQNTLWLNKVKWKPHALNDSASTKVYTHSYTRATECIIIYMYVYKFSGNLSSKPAFLYLCKHLSMDYSH